MARNLRSLKTATVLITTFGFGVLVTLIYIQNTEHSRGSFKMLKILDSLKSTEGSRDSYGGNKEKELPDRDDIVASSEGTFEINYKELDKETDNQEGNDNIAGHWSTDEKYVVSNKDLSQSKDKKEYIEIDNGKDYSHTVPYTAKTTTRIINPTTAASDENTGNNEHVRDLYHDTDEIAEKKRKERDLIEAKEEPNSQGNVAERVENSNNIASQVEMSDTVMSPERVTDNTNVKEEECTKTLPQCIVIGVQKGGTSALVQFLKFHPKIKVGQNVGDEMQYFTVHYRKGLEWYRSKMPCSKPGDITMEKSPPYFIYKNTAEKVYKYNSTVQLILTVIDPIQRALSAYVMDKAHGKHKNANSFEEVVTGKKTGLPTPKNIYLKRSYYDSQLVPWLKYFSMKQIHIVNGKELIDNPLKELKKVETFLGVQSYFTEDTIVLNSDKGFYCPRNITTGNLICLGDNKGRPHPQISQPTLGHLQQLFKPHNEHFFDMIGQRLDWGY